MELGPGLGAPRWCATFFSAELSCLDDDMGKWTNPELELGVPKDRQARSTSEFKLKGIERDLDFPVSASLPESASIRVRFPDENKDSIAMPTATHELRSSVLMPSIANWHELLPLCG